MVADVSPGKPNYWLKWRGLSGNEHLIYAFEPWAKSKEVLLVFLMGVTSIFFPATNFKLMQLKGIQRFVKRKRPRSRIILEKSTYKE